jgi:hypothetical protein
METTNAPQPHCRHPAHPAGDEGLSGGLHQEAGIPLQIQDHHWPPCRLPWQHQRMQMDLIVPQVVRGLPINAPSAGEGPGQPGREIRG